jgi:probable rRNA maturation factor
VKLPKLTLYNHQRGHKTSVRWIQKIARNALPDAMKAAKVADAPLLVLPEIEVSIVTDEEIARVHAEFLSDATPTDVITFQHGEILVSADTAARQGAEHSQDIDTELALYVIHGLLHLAGWEDEDPDEQKAMHRVQDEILAACVERLKSP